jgi:beta-phosphoglucomutase-like phosphatase (HAD superfamily)
MELNKDELLVFEGTVEGIISAKRAGLNVIGLKPELTDTNDFVRNEQRKENTLQMIEENAKCVLNDFIDLKYEYLEYM